MIRVVTGPPIASFVTRLTARARAIGRAEAEMRLRAARNEPARWHKASLLWPLFGDR